MTTPLFLLRCVELGLTISDLELLDYGLAIDMFTERANDDTEYDIVAEQEDMDNF